MNKQLRNSLFSILAVLVICTTSHSQTWQTPTQIGNSNYNNQPLYGVYFTNTMQGWAVGEGGLILTTSNGGTSWSQQTSGSLQLLRSVYFTSATQGWAVGNSGTILTTSNSGSTWSSQTSGTLKTLKSVYFTSATQGWAVGDNGTILFTTNGGITWLQQTNGTSDYFNSVYFTSATQGSVVSASGAILTTTNGGVSWTTQTLTTKNLNSVYFIDTLGWAVGEGGTVFTTSNRGISWTAQTSGTMQILNSVFFSSGTQGCAVGNVGTILTTNNGGLTWTAQIYTTKSNLNSVYFTSTTRGCVVGNNNATILTTNDGGGNWTAQSSGTSQALNSTCFISATQGCAVGSSGKILTTINGGITWIGQSIDSTKTLYSVYFPSATQGWAVGSSGTIFTTNNGGSSWTPQNSGTTQLLYSVYFTSTTQGWAVGNFGTILSTTNSGTTWSKQTIGTSYFNSVFFISSTQGWAVGSNGNIVTTNNGGSTWTVQNSGTTQLLNSVFFTSATQGWAVGSNGTILNTNNGGSTWVVQTSGTTNYLRSVYFTSATQGWIVGEGGIRTTNNGGSSWTLQQIFNGDILRSIYFTSGTQGCAVGLTGTILLYSPLIWTGNTSTSWQTANNWKYNVVPSTGDDVIIPSTGVTNEPVISTATTLGNLTVQPERTLTVNNTLTITGGLTLQSNAAGTAQIGTSTGSINGNVTVERYVPSNNRKKYTLVTSPVNNPTIYNAWQEGGVNTNAGYGTQITGAAAGNGFDAASATGVASIYTYNDNNTIGNKWVDLNNTNNTTLGSGKGYLLYVRGDRTENRPVTGNSSNSILRATGTLTAGTYTTSGLITGANKYNLVANPYAAAIDWLSGSITKTQLSGFFTVYDPNLGVFVTSDGTTKSPNVGQQQVRYIQSGQAFFIQNNATGTAPVLSITEAAKVTTVATAASSTVFGNEGGAATLSVNIYKAQDSAFADGAVAMFDKNYKASIDNEDAGKFSNFNETVGFLRNKQLLSIEKRPLHTKDTLFLNLANFSKSQYNLIIDGSNFIGANAVLEDKYTNTKQAINLTGATSYGFTINNEETSNAADRFMIVFGSASKQTTDAAVAGQLFVKVSPNPVKEQLQVSFKTATVESTIINVVNSLGQVVRTVNAGKSNTGTVTISTANLATGAYSVQLISGGKHVITHSIVKE